MKRIALLITLLSALFAGQALAQLNGSGYYRVTNAGTGRYITVHDNKGSAKVSGGEVKADMGAVEMISGFDNVVTDPASVLYIIDRGSDSYDITAQGTSTYEIMQERHMAILPFPDGTYAMRVTAKGFSVILADDMGAGLCIFNSQHPNRFWNITPMNSTDNYFAVQPEFEYQGKYYTTLFTEYPYQLSEGMRAFYVSDFDADKRAVLTEITDKVPGKTAVLLECSSNSVEANKLFPVTDNVPAVGKNYLKGVYFNINKTVGGYKHKNQTAYNAKTMRVLGLAGGEPAFVKSSQTTLAANKAYLELPEGVTFGNNVPIQLFEVTDDPVTVTARSYTMKYGDPLPTFSYDVEGGNLVGAPQITCNADRTSPVGTYDIVISQGSVLNKNATFINGKLTIEQAPLSVYAGDYRRQVGEPNPEFEAYYGGFRNGDGVEVILTKPVVTTTATQDSPAGVYEVTASGAYAVNYEMKYIPGTLTIEDPELSKVTLRANDCTMKYGDALPEFSFTQTGDADLGGEPLITCEATSQSPVGTYPITITRGTVTYGNVVYESGTLTIEPAVLTVSVGDYTIQQGEPIPEFQLHYEGFKNEETEAVITEKPVATTEATEDSAPGQYPIVVSGGAAPNYTLQHVNGTLNVVEATPVTVTVNDYTIQYGDEIPLFEYEVTGGNISGVPYIECEATSQSPVGTYPITISKGSVTNFNVTYVAGTLTIVKAPLVATTNDYTIRQGNNIPDFVVLYKGFRNNEDASVLTEPAVATTDAQSDSEPGTYDIVISGGSAQNYDIVHVNAKLTILAPNSVVVTAKDVTKIYGDPLPELEYTVEGGRLGGEPVLTCEANELSPVGEYVINVEQGTVTNPKVVFVPGKLTVTKAPLTVSVGTYERHEREYDPEFVLSYEGFRNGEDPEVLTQKPVAVSMASFYSAPGEYDILITGGEATNYSFNYVHGKLIVLQGVDGIEQLVCDGSTFDVYTTTGVRVRSNTTTLKGLPKGIYVVNGRKFAIK